MDIPHWQQRFERWFARQPASDDAAHDLSHFRRVWATAQHIMQQEPASAGVVLAACYFHDIVNLPKNHPQRHLASAQAAERARAILTEDFPDFPAALHDDVAHAIHAHSFSAAVTPLTLEAKIVQDADRLESLGAIGLARVFYVSGQLGRELFESQDPLAERRPLDDSRYAVDHFRSKLLKLPGTMQTRTGRELARHNADFLIGYLAKLCAELNGEFAASDPSVAARLAD